ncbi:MAG: helix-turn-helix transcriptional regulator [Clostridium sp.]|uniref:helix-turn-helix domain-containing protein n=1 Tax=Clostridium sp. TaxID=1506 RepID=UPI0029117AF2|nr:helix-turn-helix transcriptional regulator [Clostridium sp.]MDU5111299.1 helix-turn-helix transcriptional regulator [Clostridium sp.]
MEKRNIIGDNVRRLRKEQKLTQEQLTAKLQTIGLDIDRPMLTRIELKQREVYDYEAMGISTALNIPIEDLFKKNKL